MPRDFLIRTGVEGYYSTRFTFIQPYCFIWRAKKNDWLLAGSILHSLDTNAPYQPVALPLSLFTRSKILRVWRHMISSVLTLFPSLSCVIKSSPVFAEVNCWTERERRWILSRKKNYLVEENLRQSKFVLTVMDNGIISRLNEAIGSGPQCLIELQSLEIWNERPKSVLLSCELNEENYESNQAKFKSLRIVS